MNDFSVRVVKVGGSLFQTPDLADRLARWLAQQPAAHNVLIAGGGELAEMIRQADRRFLLGQQTSHLLCLELLRVTARLLAAVVPSYRLMTGLEELESSLGLAETPAGYVFCPYRFLTEWEPSHHSHPLPADWSVTTDSIAARLATVIQAAELVLLKSADPPTAGSLVIGYFDEYFPIASAGLREVRFVNLRAF